MACIVLVVRLSQKIEKKRLEHSVQMMWSFCGEGLGVLGLMQRGEVCVVTVRGTGNGGAVCAVLDMLTGCVNMFDWGLLDTHLLLLSYFFLGSD